MGKCECGRLKGNPCGPLRPNTINVTMPADLSDTVLAGHLHAGVDYSLSDKTLLGLKLTYSMLGRMEARDGYAIHPFHEQDPDFSNSNRFTGARSWALTFTAKRLFGN